MALSSVSSFSYPYAIKPLSKGQRFGRKKASFYGRQQGYAPPFLLLRQKRENYDALLEAQFLSSKDEDNRASLMPDAPPIRAYHQQRDLCDLKTLGFSRSI